jgi:hypothetical protein
MPDKVKKLVRACMQKTGETYQRAGAFALDLFGARGRVSFSSRPTTCTRRHQRRDAVPPHVEEVERRGGV